MRTGRQTGLRDFATDLWRTKESRLLLCTLHSVCVPESYMRLFSERQLPSFGNIQLLAGKNSTHPSFLSFPPSLPVSRSSLSPGALAWAGSDLEVRGRQS